MVHTIIVSYLLLANYAMIIVSEGRSGTSFEVEKEKRLVSESVNGIPFEMKKGKVNVCPNEEDILPCSCITRNVDYALRLECPPDTTEKQLQQVFLAEFPYKDFMQFKMEGNAYVGVLRSGVFNDVTFQEVYITLGGLFEIESGAFKGSEETLIKLQLYHNNIQMFPFNELKKYSKLEFFSVGYNPINLIPPQTFQGLSLLQMIYLQKTISTFEFQTFHNLPNLTTINLAENSLTIIPADFLTINSTHIKKIYLNNNKIEEVSPGAFEAVEGLSISLYSNQLTVLPEVTWRHLLEEDVTLVLHDNPLLCDCDIAWLVRNTSFIQHISSGTTCYDGVKIHDLNQDDYDLC